MYILNNASRIVMSVFFCFTVTNAIVQDAVSDISAFVALCKTQNDLSAEGDYKTSSLFQVRCNSVVSGISSAALQFMGLTVEDKSSFLKGVATSYSRYVLWNLESRVGLYASFSRVFSCFTFFSVSIEHFSLDSNASSFLTAPAYIAMNVVRPMFGVGLSCFACISNCMVNSITIGLRNDIGDSKEYWLASEEHTAGISVAVVRQANISFFCTIDVFIYLPSNAGSASGVSLHAGLIHSKRGKNLERLDKGQGTITPSLLIIERGGRSAVGVKVFYGGIGYTYVFS